MADVSGWERVGRQLLVKVLQEFAYEDLLVPVPVPEQDRSDLFRLDLGSARWSFRASRGSFDSWRVDPESVRRQPYDEREVGPELLFLDARGVLGWDGPTTAEALRDLIATRAAELRVAEAAIPAAELADLGHLDLEGYQNGHPCMVLNKGRLGFSAKDVVRFAPESAGDVRVTWIAVHRELASYSGVPGIDADTLLSEELDDQTRRAFAARLDHHARRTNQNARDYVWLPVHPFQFDEVVGVLFAPYLADGRIVVLGEGLDWYRPLQSVRTLANVSRPDRRNLKMPLLVRNTLTWRGLPRHSVNVAPQVYGWLESVRESDPYLRDEVRFHLMGEVASVSVRHLLYDTVDDAPYRYHELLGAIWRDSFERHLRPGERARTMACLLQVGSDGRALVAELVRRSNVQPTEWLARYFAALFPGLLHYLYAYGVAYCPHGENTVVVYDSSDVPVGIVLKDLAADVKLTVDRLPEHSSLPSGVANALLRWTAPQLAHSLLSAVLAGFFRYLAPLAEQHLGVPEATFWTLVRAEIERYHRRFPDFSDRFEQYGLLAPTFDRVALNREQLLGGGFHDRAERDENFDVVHGTVPNPLVTVAETSPVC